MNTLGYILNSLLVLVLTAAGAAMGIACGALTHVRSAADRGAITVLSNSH